MHREKTLFESGESRSSVLGSAGSSVLRTLLVQSFDLFGTLFMLSHLWLKKFMIAVHQKRKRDLKGDTSEVTILYIV
jgi:hypothetical protein